MSDSPPSALYEMLSALADGEASSFEQRRILDEMSRDEELRLAWRRMLLVRGILRDDAQEQLGSDVSERVRQALTALPSRPPRRRSLPALFGGALAAALLAAVFFAPWHSLLQDDRTEPARSLAERLFKADRGSKSALVDAQPPVRAAVERYMEWHSELPALPALGNRRARLARPVSLSAASRPAAILPQDRRLRPVSWLRQGEVEILRFSDGLQSISVFVEPISEPEAEQVLRRGSVLAYSRIVGAEQELDRLTVVGEMSLEDARTMADQVVRYALGL